VLLEGSLTALQLAGGALVIGGVLLVTLKKG
jgi:drug/metabolite transporter (DMT)-like permease